MQIFITKKTMFFMLFSMTAGISASHTPTGTTPRGNDAFTATSYLYEKKEDRSTPLAAYGETPLLVPDTAHSDQSPIAWACPTPEDAPEDILTPRNQKNTKGIIAPFTSPEKPNATNHEYSPKFFNDFVARRIGYLYNQQEKKDSFEQRRRVSWPFESDESKQHTLTNEHMLATRNLDTTETLAFEYLMTTFMRTKPKVKKAEKPQLTPEEKFLKKQLKQRNYNENVAIDSMNFLAQEGISSLSELIWQSKLQRPLTKKQKLARMFRSPL